MTSVQAVIQQIGTFALAIVLVGGSIVIAASGHDVPMWLVGFDGVAVMAVFANGQSFVQARTAIPTGNALADMLNKYHELAMTGSTATVPETSQHSGMTTSRSAS